MIRTQLVAAVVLFWFSSLSSVRAQTTEPDAGAALSFRPFDASANGVDAAASPSHEHPVESLGAAHAHATDAAEELDHEHEHEHEHVIVHRHGHAHEHGDQPYGAVARANRSERAASARVLNGKALPRGPNVQAEELLRAVPGLHVIQHAGGGKANQYFLRGFDLDHGTDIALSVDGVPVNMVSHGHGQGYADLHWVIPELVERLEVSKGPYDPRHGDFATAGAVDFQTTRLTPESRLSLAGGSFRTYRALALVGTDVDKLSLDGAAEFYGGDGPFENPQNLQRYNLFARAAYPLGAGELSLTTTAYGSSWDASGQIPLREVRAGRLGRFDAIDPSEGGSSTRHSAYARYRTNANLPQRWDVLAYYIRYQFDLYSNFTLFSSDASVGDMIHQRDSRDVSGFKVRYGRDDRVGPFTLSSRFGLELRHDAIDNGLDRAPGRELAQALVDARIDQSALGAFLEEEVEWLAWLRTAAGARVDWFSFGVRDQLEDRATLGTESSGERAKARVSPKASLMITPFPWLELYGNVGLGFHSNDARGVVRGVTPLTRALGYEAGLRSRLSVITAQLALFRLDLASELVWVGDEGTTEASGRTRRDGVEFDLRVDVTSWLFADAALSFSRGRFRDAPRTENAIPLAPTRVISGNLTVQHPLGIYGRLSLLHVADRPAIEDRFLVAQGFTRLDLTAGYRYRRYELGVRLENLLDSAYRESQFATVSRLPTEGDASACPAGTRPSGDGGFAGCEDIHFTPGFPFAAHAQATVYF